MALNQSHDHEYIGMMCGKRQKFVEFLYNFILWNLNKEEPGLMKF
jgi:hypothetical protein